MKKSLIGILFLMISVHIQASMLHNMLRTTLVSAALGTVGLNMNTMYNTVKAPTFDIEKDMGVVFFDDDIQEMLREKFRSVYTAQKPLYFAVLPIATNALAYADKNNNYIMYGYTLLPRSDKTTIDNKEHIKFRSNPPKQELLEKLARISMVSKHEIGHLAHEHIQAKKNAHNTIITAETTLNIVFGAHILKTALTKTISKPGLLGRIVSIGALLPVTRFCSLYSLAAISRKQEGEADDFAIKHATSKQELRANIDFLHDQEHARTDLLRKLSPAKRHVSSLFSTHPSTESRIAKLQNAIDNWKD